MSKITIAELQKARRWLTSLFYSVVMLPNNVPCHLIQIPDNIYANSPEWINILKGAHSEHYIQACDEAIWSLIVASFEAEDLIEKVEQP